MVMMTDDESNFGIDAKTCMIDPPKKLPGECISFIVIGAMNSQIDYTVNIGDIFTSYASLTIFEQPCVQGSEVYIDFLHGGTPHPSWQNYVTNLNAAITSIRGDNIYPLSRNFDVEAAVEKLEFLAAAFEIANP